MNYEAIPAQPSHIAAIACECRQADIDEIWAAGGVIVSVALEMSLKGHGIARTALADGVPVAMWGVDQAGCIWMIGTDAIDKYRKIFLRESRRELEQFQERHELLWNWVDARNRKAIRWLKWLGFELLDAQPYGVMRKPFHPFVRRRQKAEAA